MTHNVPETVCWPTGVRTDRDTKGRQGKGGKILEKEGKGKLESDQDSIVTLLPACYHVVYSCSVRTIDRYITNLCKSVVSVVSACVQIGQIYHSVSIRFMPNGGLPAECWTRKRQGAGSTLTRSTASNLEQIANLLCAQANSASYPQWDGK